MSESIRRPTFFRITVGLIALLVLIRHGDGGDPWCSTLDRVNRDGGYGWLGAVAAFPGRQRSWSVSRPPSRSAISLRRGEAHRGLSIRGPDRVLPRRVRVRQPHGRHDLDPVAHVARGRAPAPGTAAPSRSARAKRKFLMLSSSTFDARGFRSGRLSSWRSSREWTLDVCRRRAPVRSDLEASGDSPSRLRLSSSTSKLKEFNAASVLNEPARLAMFYPFARGKTADKDCLRGVGGEVEGHRRATSGRLPVVLALGDSVAALLWTRRSPRARARRR